MMFIFTWAIPNTPYEISCVAETNDDAIRKAIDVIQQLESVSKLTDHLTKQRLDLIKQLHTASSDSDEENPPFGEISTCRYSDRYRHAYRLEDSEDDEKKSACDPPTKKMIHKQIQRLNKEIEQYRSNVSANLFVGTVPLTSFSYTKSNSDLSLVQLVIKTEPKVIPFYPVTIRRNDVADIA